MARLCLENAEQSIADSLRAPTLRRRGQKTWIQEEALMLFTIAIILLVLWLLGMVSSYTVGGLLHILLLLALIAVVVRLVQGRRVV
jgi:hypothetical protein